MPSFFISHQTESQRNEYQINIKEESSFYLLRPKVAYAVGREKTNVGLQLFKLLFDKSAQCVKDKDTFLHFANFMEAVLAYHRAYVKKND